MVLIPLQVHITAGPQAGTRLQLNQSPASFGRSPENMLVLDLSVVSRNHGELLFEDGQWWLANLSQNGTKVGRKRVTKKPRPLDDGAAVIIGDDEVFRVYYAGGNEPAATPAATDIDTDDGGEQDQPQSAAPGTGKRSRSKLWMVLGIWFVLCIGLFVLLATTLKGGDDPGGTDSGSGVVLYQSADEVRKVLQREVERITPDGRLYNENVTEARESFLSQPRERYLYDAYDHYRQAMQYLPAAEELGPEDRQRYDQVLDYLSVFIYERYRNAYRLLKNEAYDDALMVLDELRDYYRANPNEDQIAQTINDLRDIASIGAEQR